MFSLEKKKSPQDAKKKKKKKEWRKRKQNAVSTVIPESGERNQNSGL